MESVRNMDFDKYLGAYPMDNLTQWVGLSNYITKEIIDKIDPINHVILSEEKERDLRDQEEESKQSEEANDENIDATID